jgi:20S proteasome subunit beta 6
LNGKIMIIALMCYVSVNHQLSKIQLRHFPFEIFLHCSTTNVGGLVSAIAGKGYVIFASDTRLSRGYEILSRNHLSSRIWRVQRSNTAALLPSTNMTTVTKVDNAEESLILGSSGRFISKQTVTNVYDGAYVVSAGCSADCEALKRRMQMDVRALTDWNSGTYCYGKPTDESTYLSTTGVATALGHTLYSRRGFPYYSFCIVAGMEPATKVYHANTVPENNQPSGSSSSRDNSIGVVHVYDAIGSHERVAVAAAGNGREMLQPILDRYFSVSNLREAELDPTHQSQKQRQSLTGSTSKKDGNAIDAKDQRVGLSLHPPVQTCVQCSCEEAVALLVRAYRAVSEREITVGDEVIVYIVQEELKQVKEEQEEVQQRVIPEDGGHYRVTKLGSARGGLLEIRKFPLKKH